VQASPSEIFVLLVEDNLAEAHLTQEALRECGHPCEMEVVHDGEMATQFLRREGDYAAAPTPNVILLDLNLPRKDGRELLREIKSDPGLSSIPVIVVSNSHSPEDIKEVYRLKGNCYLVKPPELQELFAMIRSLVDFWFRRVRLPPIDTLSSRTTSTPSTA
jgi:CheY-like chemotaxis protein